MHRADSRARQHRNRRLRNHRQINNDPVPLRDPVPFEHIRESANLIMQLLVSQHPHLARLAVVRRLPFPDQRGFIGDERAEMPVQAIRAQIELPAHEPFRKRRLPLQHLLPRLEPDQLRFGLLRPEFFRRPDRLVIQLAILRHRFDVRLLRKPLRRRENARLLEHGSDPGRFHFVGHKRETYSPSNPQTLKPKLPPSSALFIALQTNVRLSGCPRSRPRNASSPLAFPNGSL